MAKLRGNTDSNDGSSTAQGGVRQLLTERVDTSGRLVLGFTIFFAAWLLASYTVDVFASSEAISALAAISFYFGVVFAVFTVALGIVLAVLNAISDARRRRG
jgi:hypothetical protein